MGQANLRKKRENNGLVGSKNIGGEGQPKEKRENKWISRGLKTGGGDCQPKEKEKTND